MDAHPRFYSPYDEPLWRRISEDAMCIQRCSECGQYRYPPGACCPGCLSTEATWQKIRGYGRVLSWTTIHRQYLPAYPAGTTVVAVRLEEGPILLSNIDAAEVDRLALDASAKVIYGDHADGYRIPRFTLVAGIPT